MTSFHMGARSPENAEIPPTKSPEVVERSVARPDDGKQRLIQVFLAPLVNCARSPGSAALVMVSDARTSPRIPAGRAKEAFQFRVSRRPRSEGVPVTPKFFRILGTWAVVSAVGLLAPNLAGCSSPPPGTIGAALGQSAEHRLFVRSMPPGQGADRAGLLVDDEIVAIDGKDVRSMSPDDVRRAVRGDVGSTLVITILRGTERREMKIVRTPLLATPAKP
jgi:hypothetical protein